MPTSTPSHAPQYNDAILGSDCRDHFVTSITSISNKQVAANPVDVTLPNGSPNHSTHTSTLHLPELPLPTTRAHICSGITQFPLLSVPKLCNNNCQVLFYHTHTDIIKSNKIILQGLHNKVTSL